MTKAIVTPEARRRLVKRSTEASARLSMRVVPDDHVSSDEARQFIASLRDDA